MSDPRNKPRVVVCSCPTCGQTLPDADIRVDLTSNVLLADNRAIKLQARQAEVLWYLLKKYPETIAREMIISNVWTNVEVCDKTVNSAIAVLRCILGRIGWTIKCERGLGYRVAPHSKVPQLSPERFGASPSPAKVSGPAPILSRQQQTVESVAD